MTTDKQGVLRRKLAATARPADAGVETGGRAWRVSLARAARDCIGLDLSVPVLRDDRRSLGELLDLMPDRALLAVLEGPERGLGLMVLSPELLAAVIETQTIGRVPSNPPVPRRPTRTDAAMSMRLIDAALAGLEAALATSPDLTWTAGFRYASFLDEARPLGLLLEDVPYRVLACDVDIANGRRQGQVMLALPAEGRGPRPEPAAPADETPLTAKAWQAALHGAVLGADVVLDGVIGRMRLPLAQALALAPGALLPLTTARIDAVAIIAPGGETVATGKLGQMRGMRALKLLQIGDSMSGVAEGRQTAAMARPARMALPDPVLDPVPDAMPDPMAPGLDPLPGGDDLPDFSPMARIA